MIAEFFDPFDIECIVTTAVELWESPGREDFTDRQRDVLGRACEALRAEHEGEPLDAPKRSTVHDVGHACVLKQTMVVLPNGFSLEAVYDRHRGAFAVLLREHGTTVGFLGPHAAGRMTIPDVNGFLTGRGIAPLTDEEYVSFCRSLLIAQMGENAWQIDL
ncbi:hypothetical protein AB0G74_32425 [Streptomyces sp. NPDC020875]|uniref:hypothetical protein n=1 Tax=Streptomyces sp. NPDC020875 TaxID=3154898 RepID=UPI0033D1E095